MDPAKSGAEPDPEPDPDFDGDFGGDSVHCREGAGELSK
jgi:hypothetical protein